MKKKLRLYTKNDIQRLSGQPGVDPKREPGRSPFRKDYARLLHAAAFRRLQGKTQLFPGDESDFFRNRLTHSLEVAQIASGIGEALNAKYKELAASPIDTDLLEFAGLAHDLGHPPFGHNGETALDELMHEWGGFEGNAQTLRILTSTEKKLVVQNDGQLSQNFGLDLTYRSLASILKYDKSIPEKRVKSDSLVKGYYQSEEELVAKIKEAVAKGYKGKFKTIECAIMDIADDIAYSTYDLEDSYHARMLSPLQIVEALSDSAMMEMILEKVNQSLKENGNSEIDAPYLMEAVVEALELSSEDKIADDVADPDLLIALRHYQLDQQMLDNVVVRTSMTAKRIGKLICQVELEVNKKFPSLSKVKLKKKALIAVETLKRINYELNIKSPKLNVIEYRGKDIVREIFNALDESKGRLLPPEWKEVYDEHSKNENSMQMKRTICDFVAGMTDRYAAEFHNALFGSGVSIFKPM